MTSDLAETARVTEMLCDERVLWASGVQHIAGIDEAGRGPLAGPVVAAAVIMPRDLIVPGVNDSKKLSARQREVLFEVINRSATAVGVGVVDHLLIDEINILNATLRAMEEAVRGLAVVPGHLLVDGNRPLTMQIPCTAIVDGDARCSAIAAASIIAKVTRDRLMADLDRIYPGYGFARHKGYGTLEHRAAIARLGPCPIHRRSFAVKLPVESSP